MQKVSHELVLNLYTTASKLTLLPGFLAELPSGAPIALEIDTLHKWRLLLNNNTYTS